MNYTLDKQEEFVLITIIEPVFSGVAWSQISQELLDAVQENPFVILNLASVQQLDQEGNNALEDWSNQLDALKGLVVIAELNEALHKDLSSESLTQVPTTDEAIDYLFMERIERQFMDES